jgi:hypothetical protein
MLVEQGDQIRLIFDDWAMFNFWQFFDYKSRPNFWSYSFPRQKFWATNWAIFLQTPLLVTLSSESTVQLIAQNN